MKTRVLTLITILVLMVPVTHAGLKPYTGTTPTPALKLADLQGLSHDLKDYRGKVVLVQFWATYCTPCRKEMPSMNRLQEKLRDVPFSILAVDMGESREEVVKFVEVVKPEFTILMDPDGHSIADWHVFAAPSSFLIDPEGHIRYTLYGGVEWDSAEIVSQIRSLIVAGE